jgi:hypothetical protein
MVSMRLCSVLVAVCLIATAGASVAAVRQRPDGITMHRLHAGVLDAEGWTRAMSTEGRFAVSLPCRFEDLTADQRGRDVPVAMSYSVGCAGPNGGRFWASRIQYKGGANVALGYFRKNMHGKGIVAPPAYFTRWRYHGLPTVDLHSADPRICEYARILYVKPGLIVLIAQAPADRCNALETGTRKFFSSLTVQ